MKEFKEHLRKFHLAAGEHHTELAKFHRACASAHEGLMGKASAQDYHEDLKNAHASAADSHVRMAEHHIEMCKAVENYPDVEPTPARESATHGDSFGGRDFREAALGDLSKIVPDGAARVIPDNPLEGLRAIPRAGAPPIADVSKIPSELRDLIGSE